MERKVSLILGTGLVLLTLAGYAKRKEPKHLFGLMNVDTRHSVLRTPLTMLLLYGGAGRSPLKNTRTILSLVGALYLVIGALGSIDKKIGGTLPSKLTKFDFVYHFTIGALALWLGSRSGRMMKR